MPGISSAIPNTLRKEKGRLSTVLSATQPVLPFHSDKATANFSGQQGGRTVLRLRCVFRAHSLVLVNELRNGDSPMRGVRGVCPSHPAMRGEPGVA
jgi:hypothetical protein